MSFARTDSVDYVLGLDLFEVQAPLRDNAISCYRVKAYCGS